MSNSGAFAAALLVVCLAVTSCTSVSDGHPMLPGPMSRGTRPVPPAATPATSAPAQPTGRSYRITTDVPGFVVTTTVADLTVRSQVPGTSWSRTYAVATAPLPVVSATAGPAASYIQCTVSVDGAVRLTTRAGGPDADVRCS